MMTARHVMISSIALSFAINSAAAADPATDAKPVIYAGTVTVEGQRAGGFDVSVYRGDGNADPKAFLKDRIFIVSTRTDDLGHFIVVAPRGALGGSAVTVRAKGYRSDGRFVGGQQVFASDVAAVDQTTIEVKADAIVDYDYGKTQNRYANKTFYYVTDRKRDDAPNTFLNTAAPNFQPTYGTLVGSVALGPPALPSGTCEQKTKWSCPGTLVLQEYAYAGGIRTLGSGAAAEDDWFKRIAAEKPAEPNRKLRILLFIHGFNTSFEGGGASLAQVMYETGQRFDVGILYSWPSAARPKSYTEDLKNADISLNENLVRILNKLGAISTQADISIIVHSMGSFVATRAISQMAPLAQPPFTNLAFFAGDIDDAAFTPKIPQLQRFAKHIFVFSNARDQALKLSQCYSGDGRLRIGQAPQKFPPPVIWYDASAAAPRAGMGHGYFASSLELRLVFHPGSATHRSQTRVLELSAHPGLAVWRRFG